MDQVGTQECASTFASLLHETGTRFLFDSDSEFDLASHGGLNNPQSVIGGE
jgi:hypothetical protein